MLAKPQAENVPERRWAGRLLLVSAASALFWLLHSFAVRSLFLAVRHSATKLGQ